MIRTVRSSTSSWRRSCKSNFLFIYHISPFLPCIPLLPPLGDSLDSK